MTALQEAASEATGYSDAVVTLLDLLGFRRLVANSAHAQDVLQILQTFQVVTQVGSFDSMFPVVESTKHHFSDTALRITPLPDDPDDAAAVAVRALFEASDVQINLVRKSILVRGAIVRGNIYQGSRGPFGPALIAAIDLEKATKFPRIAVDDALIGMVEGTSRSHRLPYVVAKHKSTTHFIDYLQRAKFEFVAFDRYLEFLKEHKEGLKPLVNEKLRSASPEYERLSWVVDYHNAMVRSLEPWIEHHGYEIGEFLMHMHYPRRDA